MAIRSSIEAPISAEELGIQEPMICICKGINLPPDVLVPAGNFLAQFRHEIKYLYKRNGLETGGIDLTAENILDQVPRIGSLEFLKEVGLEDAFGRTPFQDPAELPQAGFPEIFEQIAINRPTDQKILTIVTPPTTGEVFPEYDDQGNLAYNKEQIQAMAAEIANGRVELFPIWLESYRDRIGRYVAVRIGSLDLAEDMASDAIIRALNAFGKFENQGDNKDVPILMEAWLFKITKNLIIDHYRDVGRKLTPIELNTALANKESPEGVEDHLNRVDEINALGRALDKLSPAQRQVISLRFGQEMTSEKVAQVMGKSVGAVREMQAQAMKKLRIQLIESNGKSKMSYGELSAQVGLHYNTVEELIRAAEKRGELSLKPYPRGHKGSRTFSGEDLKKVLEFLDQHRERKKVRKSLQPSTTSS